MTENEKYQLDDLPLCDILNYVHARVSDREGRGRRISKQLNEAIEVIEGLMRFCRCFAQHHTEDVRYKDAERFLEEVKND